MQRASADGDGADDDALGKEDILRYHEPSAEMLAFPCRKEKLKMLLQRIWIVMFVSGI